MEQQEPQQKRQRNEPLFFPHYLSANNDVPLESLFTKIPINISFILGEGIDSINSNHEIIIKHSTIEQFETGLKRIIQNLHKIYKETVITLVDNDSNMSNLMSKGIELHELNLKKYSNLSYMSYNDLVQNNMTFTMNGYYTLNQESIIELRFKKFMSINSSINIKTLNNFSPFAKDVYDAFYLHTFKKNLSPFNFQRLVSYKIPGFERAWHSENHSDPNFYGITGSIENSDNFREQPMYLLLTKSFDRYAIGTNKFITKAAIQISNAFISKLPNNIGYDAIEKKFISPTIMRKMEETRQIETPNGTRTLTQTDLPKDINRHLSSYLTMGN